MTTNGTGGPDPFSGEIDKIKSIREKLERHQQNIINDLFREVCTNQASSVVSDALKLFVNNSTLKRSLNIEEQRNVVKFALYLRNHPEVRDEVFQTLDIDKEDEDDSEDEFLPQEVKGLSDEKIRMFYSALQSGEKENQRIRLMVVGMFAVGKTTLVNNLIERNNNAQTQAEERQPPIVSTEGIEVHLCEIDESNKWKKNETKHEEKENKKVLRGTNS